jgi:hypothetical protein
MKFIYWLLKTTLFRAMGITYLIMAVLFAIQAQWVIALLFLNMVFATFAGIWLGIVIRHKNQIPTDL